MFHLKKRRLDWFFYRFPLLFRHSFYSTSTIITKRSSQTDKRMMMITLQTLLGKKWTKKTLYCNWTRIKILSTDFFLHIYDHLFITLIALLKEEYNTHKKHAHSFCTRTNYFDYFRKSSSYRFRLIFCLKSTSQLMMREENFVRYIYGW